MGDFAAGDIVCEVLVAGWEISGGPVGGLGRQLDVVARCPGINVQELCVGVLAND